jgi:hypothetical protein
MRQFPFYIVDSVTSKVIMGRLFPEAFVKEKGRSGPGNLLGDRL